MKLVEIKDILVGQIRKNFDDIILIDASMPNGFSHYKAYNEFGGLMSTDVKSNHKFLAMPIIGKIGITHRIENNRLVEIPREDDLKVGDVIGDVAFDKYLIMDIKEEHYADDCQAYYYLFHNDKGIVYKADTFVERLKSIGIYGVTHEFINDREEDNGK